MTNAQQIQQIMSLHQAVIKMADKINNAPEDEYSGDKCSIDENTSTLGAGNHQNNHSVAVESKGSELSKIEANSSPHHEMAAYNSSNRLPDHQTRWNSH